MNSSPTLIPRDVIPGLREPVSRLILGVDNQQSVAAAAPLFDAFIERGGNAFDTAWGYGDGALERLLGDWLEQRGNRADVVIVDKNARDEYCTPEYSRSQLIESLDRFRTDHVDVYMLHADDESVPVGAFADVLHEHVETGRARVAGVSNWSLARVTAFNAYADEHGLRRIGVVSDNFSLARMVNPVWPGCLSAWSPAWREWLVETQTPLLPWSSQARGFFTARAVEEPDEQMSNAWFADDNWERRERAVIVADELGVEPIVVALAYVLEQPFPTFPMVGSRSLAELDSSAQAFGLALSPQTRAWLNLEVDSLAVGVGVGVA